MKAISLHQPWASLIASGKKTIETRTWPTRYRGPLLICSSKLPRVAGHLLGKALCVVQLANCRPMTKADEAAAMCECYPGAWAWILEDIKKIKPFSVRGRQGFYDVPVPSGKNEHLGVRVQKQGRFNFKGSV